MKNKIHRFFCFVLFIVCVLTQTVSAQCPGTLTATYNSMVGACLSQGAIEVTASGGTPISVGNPYVYEIITGPITRIPQTTNIFSALPAGSYVVKVSDQNCAITSAAIVVTVNYINIDLSAQQTAPSCPALNNDGSITALVVGGTAPIMYSLSGPINVGAQASGSFTGLSSGIYTVTATDACGEVRTRSVTVAPAVEPLFVAEVNPFLFTVNTDLVNAHYPGYVTEIPGACDSVRTKLLLSRVGGPAVQNVTANVYLLPSHTLVYTETTTNISSDWVKFKKGESYEIELYDNYCHTYKQYYNAIQKNVRISDFRYNCASPDQTLVIGTAVEGATNGIGNYYEISNTMTETFEIISGPNLVGTSVTSGTLSGSITAAFIPGGSYVIRVTDGCESVDLPYVIPSAPNPLGGRVYFVVGNSCIDSTANVAFIPEFVKSDVTDFIWTVNSGPTSFTDEQGQMHTITYPYAVSIANVGVPAITISNMPEGTYSITVTSYVNGIPCEDYTFPSTVTHADLTLRRPVFSAVQGCPGTGSITLAGGNSQYVSLGSSTSYTLTQTSPGTTVIAGGPIPVSQTFSNLSGTYHLTAVMVGSAANGLIPGGDCTYPSNIDTTFDLNYAPPQNFALTGLTCADGSTSTISVDSVSNGVAPFSYAIVAGPQTRPIQSSALFTGLTPGTYTLSVTDACGSTVINTVTTSIINPSISSSAASCLGEDVAITVSNYPGAAYTWSGPNGFSSTGNTATIFNYDPAIDAGTYEVTINFPSCPAIVKSVVLGNCTVLAFDLLDFTVKVKGCTVKLFWKTAAGASIKSFEIERSTDGGINFKTIATITANSNANYYYDDLTPINGRNIYRIKMTEADGVHKFTKILLAQVNCNGVATAVVYPNPTSGALYISGLQGSETIRLISVNGQLLINKKATGTKEKIDISAYANGIYELVIINKTSGVSVTKIIKK